MSGPSDLRAFVERTLPHQPPFRLIDRLISNEAGVAIGEKRVTLDDPLVADALPTTLVLEALAQTAALIAGAEVGHHRGYLVALRDVRVEGTAAPGDTLTLRAERTATMGALHRVRAEARVGDRPILAGELTFAIERQA